MRRSAKGHSRLTRMPPRRDVVLTGFALAPGTRRSLDAARFLVEAGRDEAAGNIGSHGVNVLVCRYLDGEYMDGEFWLVTAEKDQ